MINLMVSKGRQYMKNVKSKSIRQAKVHVHLTPAEALKIIRQLQNLSQNQLSELTGIPQSNISALENGSCQMGRDRALV